MNVIGLSINSRGPWVLNPQPSSAQALRNNQTPTRQGKLMSQALKDGLGLISLTLGWKPPYLVVNINYKDLEQDKREEASCVLGG